MPSGLQDFWRVYDQHFEEISARAAEVARAHPEFGPLIRGMSADDLVAQNQRSRAKLARAVAGEWDAYAADLRAQGETYARMGISFAGWFDLTRVVHQTLLPLLVREYGGDSERLVGAIGGMNDFLDRAMAEMSRAYLGVRQEALAERRLRLYVDSVHDYAMITLDTDGNITMWNTGAERLKGYRADEVMGKHFSIFYLPEEIARGVPARELEVATAEGRFEDEGWRLRKDGTRFWGSIIVTAMRDEAGVLQGFAKVTRDFTDRKRAQRELALLNERLAEQNQELVRVSRAKTDFMAMMSHELRTPLNSIIGFSEVLLDQQFGPLNERQSRYVRNVNESGRHLLALINDLLDLSKIEAGRLDIVPQPCSPRALITDAAATLQPLADGKRIRLELAPPADAQLVLRADGARLKQVLYNLLSNAIKFTPAGGLVRVGYERAPTAGMLRISVTDSGPGISPADQARLFAAFTQLDNAKEHERHRPRAGAGQAAGRADGWARRRRQQRRRGLDLLDRSAAVRRGQARRAGAAPAGAGLAAGAGHRRRSGGARAAHPAARAGRLSHRRRRHRRGGAGAGARAQARCDHARRVPADDRRLGSSAPAQDRSRHRADPGGDGEHLQRSRQGVHARRARAPGQAGGARRAPRGAVAARLHPAGGDAARAPARHRRRRQAARVLPRRARAARVRRAHRDQRARRHRASAQGADRCRSCSTW